MARTINGNTTLAAFLVTINQPGYEPERTVLIARHDIPTDDLAESAMILYSGVYPDRAPTNPDETIPSVIEQIPLFGMDIAAIAEDYGPLMKKIIEKAAVLPPPRSEHIQ